MEEWREEATYQERRGPAVDTLDDSQLFFVDKVSVHGACERALCLRACMEPPPGSSNVKIALYLVMRPLHPRLMQDADRNAATAGGERMPRKRGAPSGPKLLLRSQVILQQAHKAKPVLHYKPPRKINNAAAMANKGKGEAVKCRTKFAAIPGEKYAL